MTEIDSKITPTGNSDILFPSALNSSKNPILAIDEGRLFNLLYLRSNNELVITALSGAIIIKTFLLMPSFWATL